MNCDGMTLPLFFSIYPRVVIAYSGGIDSTYLLYVAKQHAQSVRALYVKTAFQPEFELKDAREFCRLNAIDLEIISCDILQCEEVVSNPQNRCYYCKRAIFETIAKEAACRPHDAILDGTNADDDEGDRPGMKALRELGVLSPLRMCGMTKAMIRQAAKQAGIAIWNKPAYACLATRIAHGERITQSQLRATEESEAFLMQLGFVDFRIRQKAGTAIVQIRANDFLRLMENRTVIFDKLRQYYDAVTLDLRARDE